MYLGWQVDKGFGRSLGVGVCRYVAFPFKEP